MDAGDASARDAAAARTQRLQRLGSGGGGSPAAQQDSDSDDEGWTTLSPDRRAASHWAADETAAACTGCTAPFTIMLRRHHCRNCGQVFCAACTAFRKRGEDTGRSHRVCAPCAGGSSGVGSARSVADATNDFASAVADTAHFAAGSLVPRLGAVVTAPIQGAAAGFGSGGGRGAADGFIEGLGRGGGGFLKGSIRTVGLATKGAVAAGRLGYHGASAIGSSIVNAAEDAQLGEAASELVAAPMRRHGAAQGGGARGFVAGVAEGVGGLTVSAASTVGLTAKDLGERTVAVTQRVLAAEDGGASAGEVEGVAGAAATTAPPSPQRSQRFRPAFDPAEDGAGLKPVVVYENQRRPLVLGGEFGREHLFRVERGPESDVDGQPTSRRDPGLPGDGWRWVGGWYVVWEEFKTDDEGWQYNFNWPEPGEERTAVLHQGWSAEPSDRFGAQTWVRRRRWERLAAPLAEVMSNLPDNASSRSSTGIGDDAELVAGGGSEVSPASPHRESAAYVRTQLTPREKARRMNAEAEAEAEEADLRRSASEIDAVKQEMQNLQSSWSESDITALSPAEPDSEPEPAPEPQPAHWMAAGIESSGKMMASGIMRGALSVGAAARYGQEVLVEKTERRDTGPVSQDTKEIVQLSADVSEDLLEASRVVSSGVFTVFKTLGKSAVAGAETISTAVMGENDADGDESAQAGGEARGEGQGDKGTGQRKATSEEPAGGSGAAAPTNMDLAVEIGTAGVETAVDIYHTFRRGVQVATSEVVGAAAIAVEHRHGADAGETARTVGNTVQNLGTAAFHAVSVHSAGVLDVAAEAAAHIAGKDTWLEGEILHQGKLAREALFAGGTGAGVGGGEDEPVGWWELRKNSLAVRVGLGGELPSAAATAAAVSSPPLSDAGANDGGEERPQTLSAAPQLADYELIVPLGDVRDMSLLNVDGTRAIAASAEAGLLSSSITSSAGTSIEAAGHTEEVSVAAAPASFAWCVCSNCSSMVKYRTGPAAVGDNVTCTSCGAALTVPATSRPPTSTAGRRLGNAAAGTWTDEYGQQQLLIAVVTVDDVRLCLRAATPTETKAWASALQLAIENNEERKRATWAVDMKHRCRPGARWMADDEAAACLSCGADFTRWKRRHHCRNCGALFCDECSAWEHTVPGCGAARMRVCAPCLAELEGMSSSPAGGAAPPAVTSVRRPMRMDAP
jgi:hypothetical protein